jgi:modulator of FtsH protease HflK
MPFDLEQLTALPRKLLLGVIGCVVAIGALSSFYVVPTDSTAVVQRFGRYLSTTAPGLRFKLPFGIDTASIVPIQRQLKLEFGFGTRGATNLYQVSDQQEEERSMVTGDLNAAHVEWVVQYGIDDEKAYLFEFNNPEETLRDMSENVVREIVGDRTIDEVLTSGRNEMAFEAKARLQKLVSGLRLGFRIESVQMINVNPPREVRASFDEVNSAKQAREQTINEARKEYNSQVPQAEGTAAQKISVAEGYALKRINEAEGDVSRFNALLTEYTKAPEVTRRRIYLETMSEILPTLRHKVILDDKATQVLPLLQIPGAKAVR